jgi:hypothetical protein
LGSEAGKKGTNKYLLSKAGGAVAGVKSPITLNMYKIYLITYLPANVVSSVIKSGLEGLR